jgi:uncharacterized membrane protein
MSNRTAGWITGALTLAGLIAGAWTVTRIGPGHSIAVHFGVDGRPNGWAPARVGLFIFPAINAMLWGLQMVLPRVTPRGANLIRSGAAYGTIWITVAVVMALAQAAIIAGALGRPVNVTVAVPIVIGLTFIIVGNVLPKLRWNYVVGIRTPWTLADERVWDKTHRFGGWVMVLGGAVLVIGALVPPYVSKPGLVAGVSGLIAVLAVGKSYLLWREAQPRGPANPIA